MSYRAAIKSITHTLTPLMEDSGGKFGKFSSERLFNPDGEILRRLASNTGRPKFVKRKHRSTETFTDLYFDRLLDRKHVLASNNIYLRHRRGRWQMKCNENPTLRTSTVQKPVKRSPELYKMINLSYLTLSGSPIFHILGMKGESLSPGVEWQSKWNQEQRAIENVADRMEAYADIGGISGECCSLLPGELPWDEIDHVEGDAARVGLEPVTKLDVKRDIYRFDFRYKVIIERIGNTFLQGKVVSEERTIRMNQDEAMKMARKQKRDIKEFVEEYGWLFERDEIQQERPADICSEDFERLWKWRMIG
jgi:hypothetical protein